MDSRQLDFLRKQSSLLHMSCNHLLAVRLFFKSPIDYAGGIIFHLGVAFFYKFVMSHIDVAGDTLWECLETQAGPFPVHLKKVLGIAKYDTLYKLAHLSDHSISSIEYFMRWIVPLLIMEDERYEYYHKYTSAPEMFQFSDACLKILADVKSCAEELWERKKINSGFVSSGSTCLEDPDKFENGEDSYNYEPVIVERGALYTKISSSPLEWRYVEDATVALVKPDDDHILPWIRSQIKGVVLSQALPIKDFEQGTKRYRALGDCFEWSAYDFESGHLRHFRLTLSSSVAANHFSRKFDDIVDEFQQEPLAPMCRQRLDLDAEACRKHLVGNNEKLVFSERAKLFTRHDEWQEIGVGEVGITYNADSDCTRLVFVIYHVGKVVLDCVLTAISPSFRTRLPLAAGIMWTGMNYARNAHGEHESLAIRFHENEKQRAFIKTLVTYLDESVSYGNDSKIAMIVDLSETLFREKALSVIRQGAGQSSSQVDSQVSLIVDYHNKMCSIVVRGSNGVSFTTTTVIVTPTAGDYMVFKTCFRWISWDKDSGTNLKIDFSTCESAISLFKILQDSFAAW